MKSPKQEWIDDVPAKCHHETSQLDEEANVMKQVSWTSNQEVTFSKDDPPARLQLIPAAPNSLPNRVPSFVSRCSTPSTSMGPEIPVATPANSMPAKANHDLVEDQREGDKGHDWGRNRGPDG